MFRRSSFVFGGWFCPGVEWVLGLLQACSGDWMHNGCVVISCHLDLCRFMNPSGNHGTAPWNLRHLGLALFCAMVLQGLIHPCLCAYGAAKMALAFSFDGLMALRILLAYLFKETGNGWKAYAALIWTSPLWIEAVAYWILGPH